MPLEEERKRRKQRGDAWDVPIVEVEHRQNKEARMLGLEPLIANGWVIFNRALPEEFFRQLEDVPSGIHDDGPDALEAALTLCKSRNSKFSQGLNKSTQSRRATKKPLAYF